ncbi:MAG: MgtC/SapB family protein, partial [Variibacter sp.]|nr:MgtC/SapB family protein [Variibacter sp.]
METLDPFLRLGAALGIGLLVGLERGWSTRADQPGTRTAGVRTFALIGLLGGVIGAVARALGEGGGGLAFGLAFLGFAGVFGLFCREENRAEGGFSATTAVAGMATFTLAAYAVAGDTTLAVAGAVAMTMLLALREGLHAWISRITEQEMRSGLLLLAMTFIALPLLPDRTIGPFGGVNPREVWLIAIVLAAVSFFGYAVVRVVGETRGILLAAAAGGLVSSTAVMLNSARQAAAGEGMPRLLAGGAMLATAISLARAAAIVAVLNPAVFQVVWAPLAAAAA